MLRALSLWASCFILWLLLSGYFHDPWLVGFGALSSALVTFIGWRAEAFDTHHPPPRLLLVPQLLLSYWPWLLQQIIQSNLDVARTVLDPKLPISPTLITLKPGQPGDLGRVIYANSITLTPGTVTTGLRPDALQVHALTRAAARDLEAGEMDRRVRALEV